MLEYAEKYLATYEGLNKWIKFVLNFFWAIPTNLYRLAKSVKKDDMLGIVVAVILLISCGFWLLAVIDLCTIAFKNKVYWLDDFMSDNGSSTPEDKTEGNADKID